MTFAFREVDLARRFAQAYYNHPSAPNFTAEHLSRKKVEAYIHMLANSAEITKENATILLSHIFLPATWPAFSVTVYQFIQMFLKMEEASNAKIPNVGSSNSSFFTESSVARQAHAASSQSAPSLSLCEAPAIDTNPQPA